MAVPHDRLMARIQELPDVALPELAVYLDFLLWKTQLAKTVVEMPVIDDEAAPVEELEETYGNNPRSLQLLEEARERVRENGGIPLAEFKQRVAMLYTVSDQSA